MNIITAIIIGFLVSLAFYVLYYLVLSGSITDMKRNIWADIKSLDSSDVVEFLLDWVFCSVVLFVVINVCGMVISIFIALDVNIFELVFDVISYDPLAHLNLTALS